MVEAVLVGWCPECRMVEDPYPGPNTPCSMGSDCETLTLEPRKLHKRRMFHCEGCLLYWKTRTGLDTHRCGDWE